MNSPLKTADGRLIIVSGASRCGKTTQVAREVRNEARLCAWDPEDQWAQMAGWTKVTTRKALLATLEKKGRMRVAYVAGGDIKKEFDYWAAAVFYAGRYVAPLTIIAEELADVTNSGKAPPAWGQIIRRGLKRGITIYAISQRWAEADKTAIGNCSEFRIFTSRGEDVDYIARKARISADEIDLLKPFEFISFDPVNKKKLTNKVSFD